MIAETAVGKRIEHGAQEFGFELDRGAFRAGVALAVDLTQGGAWQCAELGRNAAIGIEIIDQRVGDVELILVQPDNGRRRRRWRRWGVTADLAAAAEEAVAAARSSA